MSNTKGMNRRNFLKNSAIGMVGAGVVSQAPGLKAEETPGDEPLKIKAYRTLGRTGFKVSDIGSGGNPNPAVLKAVLEAGVNYIDTAESYGRGQSETTIGKVIKDFNRKSLFITTKLSLRKDFTKEKILERSRKCLERLQTDYIDCMMIHSCQTAQAVKSEGFHAAVKQLKSEGKVRFVGISNHGSTYGKSPETMEKVLMAAVADGRFDVMLLVYNFVRTEMGERILKACAGKNIGTTLMKTKPVDRYFIKKEQIEARAKKEGKEISQRSMEVLAAFKKSADMATEFTRKHNLKDPREIREAAVRFVLENQNVNTVCINFLSFDDVEPYIKLSGSSMTAADKKKLALYLKGCGDFYCRHACGQCESQCPQGVPVNTIMRYNHYFESQGREKYAMEKYAALPTAKAGLCENCDGRCETACPYNVHIQGLLTYAHRNLSLV